MSEVHRCPNGHPLASADAVCLECNTGPSQDAIPLPSPSLRAVLPGYEDLTRLGEGGMGIVYKARQLRPRRTVALKMIRAGHLAGKQDLDRFRAEADAVACLQHPNIVNIYEVGEHQGQPYFSMEFVDGGSLAEKAAGTPLTPRQAAALVETLARTMNRAHQQGIVHLDLKPENILLTAQGAPKIADFGLARQLDQEGGGDSLGGTLEYMAPEQARGLLASLLTGEQANQGAESTLPAGRTEPGGGVSRRVGPAADVYALGAILYRLLVGRPPLLRTASLEGSLRQVIRDAPPPPTQLVARLPRDLEQVCLRCLEKDPQKRYASAEALADDLRRFQNGVPVPPASTWRRAVYWMRRQPAAAGILLLVPVSVLAVVVALVSLAARQRVESAREETERAKEEADRQRDRAEAEAWLRRHYQYVGDMNLAHRFWREGRLARMTQLLARHRPAAAGQPDLRGFDWYLLWRLRHSALQEWTTEPAPIQGLAFGPDGERLAAYGFADRPLPEPVHVWRLRQTKPTLALAGGNSTVRAIAFGKGGLLATAGNPPVKKDLRRAPLQTGPGEVNVWQGDMGVARHKLSGHHSPVLCLAFDPSGNRLASGGDTRWLEGRPLPGEAVIAPGELKVWDAVAGRELLELKGHQGAIYALAFSGDGKYLAAATGSVGRQVERVLVWESIGGKPVSSFAVPVAYRGESLAFDPDGTLFAAADAGGETVKVWQVITGKELLTLKRGRGAAAANDEGGRLALAFDARGHRLALGGAGGAVEVWDVSPGLPGSANRLALTFRGHTRMIRGLMFSPDGSLLASGDVSGLVKLWDATADQEALRLGPVASGPLTALSYGADGGRLLGLGPEGVVVWDLVRARGPWRPWAIGDVGGGVLSADGTWLACFDRRQAAVCIWDLRHVQAGAEPAGPTRTLRPCPPRLTVLALREDGGGLAAIDDGGRVHVWDLSHGKDAPRRTLPVRSGVVDRVVFSADGRWLVTTERSAGTPPDTTVRLWDVAASREVRAFPLPRATVGAVALDPEGGRLAVAVRRKGLGGENDEHFLRLFDLASGREAGTLRGFRDLIVSAVFSPDGRRLASCEQNGRVRLWDVQLEEEILVLESRLDSPQVLAFSRDSRGLALAGAEEVVVWDTAGPDRPAAARGWAGLERRRQRR
jgi:WD40 repeat protein